MSTAVSALRTVPIDTMVVFINSRGSNRLLFLFVWSLFLVSNAWNEWQYETSFAPSYEYPKGSYRKGLYFYHCGTAIAHFALLNNEWATEFWVEKLVYNPLFLPLHLFIFVFIFLGSNIVNETRAAWQAVWGYNESTGAINHNGNC